ncbi:DUF2946 family protein [Ideonella oryzae]|uniref:DUF2946 family protein n=1 Tax=Ideonella oryzae TaxID=2937441 RepID=A0ABT1BMN5_9BURK|nr:DUF2946 family protein [Ideonella oryzae]MCO5977492.1 DUF2946 family protein [Ideonella oryzae]
MPRPSRHQRLSTWLASLGFLLGLLAPLVTHALAQAGADVDAALATICSASHAGPSDTPVPGHLPDEDHHCLACVLLPPLASPPSAGLLALAPPSGPAHRLAAPPRTWHREPVWPAAQARAPPPVA